MFPAYYLAVRHFQNLRASSANMSAFPSALALDDWQLTERGERTSASGAPASASSDAQASSSASNAEQFEDYARIEGVRVAVTQDFQTVEGVAILRARLGASPSGTAAIPTNEMYLFFEPNRSHPLQFRFKLSDVSLIAIDPKPRLPSGSVMAHISVFFVLQGLHWQQPLLMKPSQWEQLLEYMRIFMSVRQASNNRFSVSELSVREPPLRKIALEGVVQDITKKLTKTFFDFGPVAFLANTAQQLRHRASHDSTAEGSSSRRSSSASASGASNTPAPMAENNDLSDSFHVIPSASSGFAKLIAFRRPYLSSSGEKATPITISSVAVMAHESSLPPKHGRSADAAADGFGTWKQKVLTQIFERGICPDSRPLLWLFLLHVYDWRVLFDVLLSLPHSSSPAVIAEKVQRSVSEVRSYHVSEYETIRNQWTTITARQLEHNAAMQDRMQRIDKDVIRTDRHMELFSQDDCEGLRILNNVLMTYTVFNFDLGYCQGMNDLLSPVLYVIRDEYDTYFAFLHLMEDLGFSRNFLVDQTGIQRQLTFLSNLVRSLHPDLFVYLEEIDAAHFFFCFRWLIVLFKREFEMDEILRLWEALFSCQLDRNFHIYVCAGLVLREADVILERRMRFDELLAHMNDIRSKIPSVESLLLDAEATFFAYQAKSAADKRRGHAPEA